MYKQGESSEEPWGCATENASRGKAVDGEIKEESRLEEGKSKRWAWSDISHVAQKKWTEKDQEIWQRGGH